MPFSRRLVLAAALAAFMLPAVAPAQSFPDKPVRVILPFPVGGGADVVMRLVGSKLAGWWGQSVLVDNRPGGNGFIALEAAKRSAPDGYTLLVADVANMSVAPSLYKRLPYDPVKDFDPVAPMFSTHFFVTVAAGSQWKNIPELVAAAKARKGTMTYGSVGVGSQMHLGGAMLAGLVGAPMNHIPYKDLTQTFQDVSKGDLDWAFGSGATTAPLYQAKRLKYLAIAAPERHPSYPDIPTMGEAGGPPNFELRAWVGLYAPHGAPQRVIQKVNADMARALREPDVEERLKALGIRVWTGSAEELKKTMSADEERYREVIKRVNISLD